MDEGFDAAKRGRKTGTDDPVVISLAASAFEERADEAEAIRLYEAALDADPDLDVARAGLVRLLIGTAERHLNDHRPDDSGAVCSSRPGGRRRIPEGSSRPLADPRRDKPVDRGVGRRRRDGPTHAGVVRCPHRPSNRPGRARAPPGRDRGAEARAELDPTNARAWKLLGSVFAEDSGRQDAATDAYRRVIDLDADDREALLGLSLTLDRLHHDSEAADLLAPYTAAHPDDSAVWRNGASGCTGRTGTRRISRCSDTPSRWTRRTTRPRHMGLAHIPLDQWSQAVAVLRPLVEKETYRDNAYACASLAFALMALDEHSEAAPLTSRVIRPARHCVRVADSSPSPQRDRLVPGRDESAREAIRFEPETGWPYQSLAWAIELGDDPVKAIAAWSDAEHMNPGDPWTTKGRANALARGGMPEQATRVYLEVLASVDEKARAAQTSDKTSLDADDLALRGWCRLCLGEYADAVKVMISALIVRPRPSDQFDLALAMLCAAEQAGCGGVPARNRMAGAS